MPGDSRPIQSAALKLSTTKLNHQLGTLPRANIPYTSALPGMVGHIASDSAKVIVCNKRGRVSALHVSHRWSRCSCNYTGAGQIT
eukprot:scaffold7387_cov408-Prasinococcus_capsulatus_cf.AAC.8